MFRADRLEGEKHDHQQKQQKNHVKICSFCCICNADSACVPQNGIVTAQAKTAAMPRTKSYVVASDILNVRCGPGTDYAVIGSLTRGLRVKVISISGEKGNRWAKIRFEGVRAYVSAQYLTKTVS